MSALPPDRASRAATPRAGGIQLEWKLSTASAMADRDGEEFTRMLSVAGEPCDHTDARRGDIRCGMRPGRALPMTSVTFDYAGAQGYSRGEAA